MATVPEFISVLRKIRDVIYPEVNALYEDSLVLKESIDVGKAEFDADLIQFNTDYSDFNTQKNKVDASVLLASQSATSANNSAVIATNKSNEIKAITAQSTTGAPGTSASASYNPTDGKFTFVIPQGSKGDKGESFTVNSSGLTAQRALYDAQPAGWSFLDITTSTLYFKASSTSGDWSSGVPFGRGDTGDTGDTGVGIESFTYVSTNHTSGLPAQSGGTDIYRVTLTNALTFDYNVYNGLDADLTYVDTSIANVQANVDANTSLINSHSSIPTAYHIYNGSVEATNTVVTNGFSTTLYTGNGGTQSVVTGVDMATRWGNDASETYGGLSWIKGRSGATNNYFVDSVRGATKDIYSNATTAETTEATGLTAFTSAGFSLGALAGMNTNTATYASWNFQTTHRRTGVTNQGKAFTEHYNPFTGFTIIKYEGSGLAGHEIPHSLDRKLGLFHVKNLTTTTDWLSCWSDNNTVFLNLANANTANAGIYSTDKFNAVNLSTGANTSISQYIMYGWANSYFDEDNTLIGNYEIGVYQGTGVAGNKVLTRGKPAWVMVKRLDSTGNWYIGDNQRGSGDNLLLPNGSNAEFTSTDYFDYSIDGFILKTTVVDMNASGGKYLYMVVYDNDSGSGKSKYPKATDTTNLSINALVPYANGIDVNGSKVSIDYKNETITGLTLTQGKNYPYSKNDGTYGINKYEPMYGSLRDRSVAGENPDYFDLKTMKWYDCDNGAELNSNSNIQSNDTASWTVSANGTLSWTQGRYTMARSVLDNNVTFTKTFTGLTAGVTYKFVLNTSRTGNEWYVSLDGTTKYTTITDGICVIYITPTTTSVAFTIMQSNINTVGISLYVNSLSIYKSNISIGAEITPRTYLDCIVYADQNGQVSYVEELPKIEYKNLVVQGENRKVINLGTIYNNNRYVVENPFGNEKYMDCDTRLELYSSTLDRWFAQENSTSDSGTYTGYYGARSTSTIDGIVISTAMTNIIAAQTNGTCQAYALPSGLNSAPARVIVTYIGVAK